MANIRISDAMKPAEYSRIPGMIRSAVVTSITDQKIVWISIMCFLFIKNLY